MGVFATGGKFSAGVVGTGGDTGRKFATGINNTSETGGKICRRFRIPVVNLPTVSLIPVVHLELRISPQICEKI
jgi:hypothetical protein